MQKPMPDETIDPSWAERLEPVTGADAACLQQLLGRAPHGVCGIAGRGQGGRILAIANDPLLPNGQPFPTLFWLVDPDVSRQVADYERRGGVKEVEAWLAAEPERLAAYHAEQCAYAGLRMALLGQARQATLAETEAGEKTLAVLRDTGIGGMASLDGVKCLHLQMAWHFGRKALGWSDGLVAQWLQQQSVINLSS